jgi:hypothetical protein
VKSAGPYGWRPLAACSLKQTSGLGLRRIHPSHALHSRDDGGVPCPPAQPASQQCRDGVLPKARAQAAAKSPTELHSLEQLGDTMGRANISLPSPDASVPVSSTEEPRRIVARTLTARVRPDDAWPQVPAGRIAGRARSWLRCERTHSSILVARLRLSAPIRGACG